LRQLRASSGLTQEQLAERAGLSANAISALERGERTHPYPHTVRALASALGLSAEDSRKLQAAASPRERGQRADLPSVPGLLIGREQEVAELTELLASGVTRMLTLTGPAGVGKTRLALAAAGEVTAGFPDGVRFVSLAPLRDPELVVPAVAHALGVRETGSGPLEQSLHGYLRNRDQLLVLDNFEHLQAAAPAIADLLAVAPRLSLLVTSRSPLRIRWERVFPVMPLRSPWAERLFRERSLQAAPDVPVDDAGVVTAICRCLDCLPLAIELAAARAALLPPPALLARLGQAITVLTGGARDLPDRQRTLRHALTWSYDLLGREEQALFRQLSTFAGGWTRRIQAVCARSSASFSDGFMNPRVLRGRSLRLAAMRARSAAEWADRSVPLGRYWRSSPLVFSFDPRCQGLCGSQK
jgi:transcriptional regulator with XRE-family HTH domain